jgi:hypothetical protein
MRVSVTVVEDPPAAPLGEEKQAQEKGNELLSVHVTAVVRRQSLRIDVASVRIEPRTASPTNSLSRGSSDGSIILRSGNDDKDRIVLLLRKALQEVARKSFAENDPEKEPEVTGSSVVSFAWSAVVPSLNGGEGEIDLHVGALHAALRAEGFVRCVEIPRLFGGSDSDGTIYVRIPAAATSLTPSVCLSEDEVRELQGDCEEVMDATLRAASLGVERVSELSLLLELRVVRSPDRKQLTVDHQEDLDAILEVLRAKLGAAGERWYAPHEICREWVDAALSNGACYVLARDRQSGVNVACGAAVPLNDSILSVDMCGASVHAGWEFTHFCVLNPDRDGKYAGAASLVFDKLLSDGLRADAKGSLLFLDTTFDRSKADGGGAWRLGARSKAFDRRGVLPCFTGIVADPKRSHPSENNHLVVFTATG